MRSITFIALLTFAYATEPVVNHEEDSEASSDKLFYTLVDQLSNRLLKVLPLDDADLDETMMGKPANAVAGTGPIAMLPPVGESNRDLLGRRELATATVAATMLLPVLEAAAAKKPVNKGPNFKGTVVKNGPMVLNWLTGAKVTGKEANKPGPRNRV